MFTYNLQIGCKVTTFRINTKQNVIFFMKKVEKSQF